MIKLITVSDDRSGRKGGLYKATQEKMWHFFTDWIDQQHWQLRHIIDCDPLMQNTDAAKNGRVYKPYAIRETLAGMDDGDFLIYNDCSPELWDHVPPLENYDLSVIQGLCIQANGFLVPFVKWAPVPITKGYGIHTHAHFTLDSAMSLMGADHCRDSYLCASGMIVIQKSPATVAIVDEWLKYCRIPECSCMHSHEHEASYNDPRPLKLGNRHDQSVLSLVLNKLDWNYCEPASSDINPHNFLNFCLPGWDYKFLNSNVK